LCEADDFNRHFADIKRLQEKIRENYGEGIGCREEVLNAALKKAVLNEDVSVVDMLLDSGADPSHCNRSENDDSYSYPLLLSAVDTGNVEIVGRLLAAGADVKQESSGSGDTPLFRAVEKSNMELVKLLVGHGANIYHMNKDGISLSRVVKSDEVRGFLKGFDSKIF
jgi:ankyrin repeat protein